MFQKRNGTVNVVINLGGMVRRIRIFVVCAYVEKERIGEGKMGERLRPTKERSDPAPIVNIW